MKRRIKKEYKVLFGIILLAVVYLITKSYLNVEVQTSYTKFEKDIVTSTLTQSINKATTQIEKGPIISEKSIAYITIDDGPSEYTNEILDILAENNIKATFFMMNNNMKKHPEELNRMKEEGHSAGFHSITHDIKELYKTPEATLNEFKTCQETLYSITGQVSKLIRLPYGSKPYMPQESYNILMENNYKIWDWNLDTLDWKSTPDNIINSVMYYGRDKSNLIILMHEKPQTVEVLDDIIKILKERGYEIRPIGENIKERNYWQKNVQN